MTKVALNTKSGNSRSMICAQMPSYTVLPLVLYKSQKCRNISGIRP
jgi:hypothetical protein